MGTELLLWGAIVFAMVHEPIIGYADFRRFKRIANVDGQARIRYYGKTMAGLWLPVLFVLIMIALTDITYKEIGFALPGIHADRLGSPATVGVLAIALLYGAALAYYGIGYRFSPKIREKLERVKEERTGQADYAVILPVTARERKWWTMVSLTAGVTEEILYRGFLIYAFVRLFPAMSVWGALLASSALFGLAHTYQGIAGVLRTALVGAFFALLFVATGSLLLPIVLHVLVDRVAGIETMARPAGGGAPERPAAGAETSERKETRA